MYKCLDCGHIFEDGEQRIIVEPHREIDGGFHEYLSECPVCGGDFDEATTCDLCGGVYLDEELINGICPDCLREAVTYDSFLGFATSGAESATDVDVLEDFMLRSIFEVDGREKVLTCSSYTFKGFLRNLYLKRVDDEKFHQNALGIKGNLLDMIRQYITDFKLWDEFSEYISEKGVKK